MAYTKKEFIKKAFGKIGLASFVYDIEPEQLQSALSDLDSMLATWNAKGIRIGYPLPSSPGNSDLDQDSNVPDSANEAIILGLAMRLAPDFGKIVPNSIKKAATEAYTALINITSDTPKLQFPNTLPRGAGTKPFQSDSNTFFNTPLDPIDAGKDGPIEL